jgi:hypothetical protein
VEPGKRLQKSVGALLIVAILHTLFAFMVLSQARAAARQGASIDTRVLIEALSLPLAFYALAVWARWMPAIASLTGLALYLGVQVFDAIGQPGRLWQGIVIKVIIVLALVQAVRAGLAYSRARREVLAAQDAGGE